MSQLNMRQGVKLDLKLINEHDQDYANKKLAKFYENQLIHDEKKSSCLCFL
jgi:hypothetical protein